MRTVGERRNVPRKNINKRAAVCYWDGTVTFTDSGWVEIPVTINVDATRAAVLMLPADDAAELLSLLTAEATTEGVK